MPSAGTRNYIDWRLLVRKRIANISKVRNLFGGILTLFLSHFLGGKYAGSPRQKFLSWQTSLLCIVGKLSGGGYVALAIRVGDM